MSFSFKKSFKTALRSSWVILKLIVPIYILADILFYYDLLRHITFIFKPFAVFLGLPQEAALSIVSGLFLNLYAAIAFAAPLGLGAKEWTILAVFLGIAHSRNRNYETTRYFAPLLNYFAFIGRSLRRLFGYTDAKRMVFFLCYDKLRNVNTRALRLTQSLDP